MNQNAQAALNIAGRVFFCLVFFMSAIGNKIPEFDAVASYMESEGVPAAKFMLAGAIGFLIVGSLSLILGYRTRVGATLLLVFLVLATYFFHDFWTFDDPKVREQQMVQFMKNLALVGATLILIARGAGPGSLDARGASVEKNA